MKHTSTLIRHQTVTCGVMMLSEPTKDFNMFVCKKDIASRSSEVLQISLVLHSQEVWHDKNITFALHAYGCVDIHEYVNMFVNVNMCV